MELMEGQCVFAAPRMEANCEANRTDTRYGVNHLLVHHHRASQALTPCSVGTAPSSQYSQQQQQQQPPSYHPLSSQPGKAACPASLFCQYSSFRRRSALCAFRSVPSRGGEDTRTPKNSIGHRMSGGCVSINCYIRKRRCDDGLLAKCSFSPLMIVAPGSSSDAISNITKMKILLVAVASLVVIEIEAHPGWSTYPGFQDRRGNNPGHGWGYPQRIEQQNNKLNTDIEWVCQNPRTNDIMIIASDNTRHTPQQNSDRESWWQWHNVPPGHQWQHHQHGNRWNKPIIIIQETPNTDNNYTPLPTTSKTPNNVDEQTNSPPYHGGEGSIDIRGGPIE
ncbi:PREDICTED: uncharacterized protein LOC105145787 isoform X2 [Acromyrmex echinatior]|uniref:uncharacterized protein LOC105145787 isoform X2 n=1 Tax=Acromyrmex echinatior TaxID=103372 RepID=UPI000580E2A9|nr:PREDICTED: uncharacterized protein LOC105145787 isoform X2 [Acromyrmex echinatior]